MNVFLWIVQAVLVAMFAMAGVMKSTRAKEKPAGQLPWTADLSQGTVRLIGPLRLAPAL
ncbi:hypothetical protein OK074_0235 [Actinobacteria bacterium OK074]|nr:hypothetical protein OK074_0235 [Actinobacteria bacterium OK074]